jgi:hypothetical protein
MERFSKAAYSHIKGFPKACKQLKNLKKLSALTLIRAAGGVYDF